MAGIVPAAAVAQNNTAIDGRGTTGTVTVNAAAGNHNQQANAGVVASGAAGASAAGVRQHSSGEATDSGGAATSIAQDAFAGSSGWIAISGVSGNANQQANLAAFTFGIEAGAAADTLLSQTRASTEPTAGKNSPPPQSERSVVIGERAFENSSGLVQVSLIGGDRNSSANSFALSVSGGANQ